MAQPDEKALVPPEFGPEELEAFAVDEPFLEVTVVSDDSLFVPLDGWTSVADAMTATPASEPPAVSLWSRPQLDWYSASGENLTLLAFGEAFDIPANAGSLAASLELAYSIGGWSLFDEVADSARAAIAPLDKAVSAVLREAITYTGTSLTSLAGNYLLQLEQRAEQLLAQVLEERAQYLGDVRRELLNSDGETVSLSDEDDGAGGRRPVKRARMLLADLESIRSIDEEVGITQQQQSTARTLALVLKAVKLKLDPFGGLLADLTSAPRWVEQVAALMGLSEAEVEEALGEFADRVALAASLASAVRVRLITREPLMAAVVSSFGKPVPIDPKEVAQALAAAVNHAALATASLNKRLQEGKLSVRNRRVTTSPVSSKLGQPIFIPPQTFDLLDVESYYDSRNRPEKVWAHILDGGALRPVPGAPSEFTLWDLAPLVTAADAALRATMGEGRPEALVGACLHGLRQQRLWQSLRTAGFDVAFGLLLGAGSLLAGPARPLFIAAEVLANFCSFAATAERFQVETEVEKSDWAGTGDTLKRLSQHAPDTLALVLEGVNLASSVLVVVPRLRVIRTLLDSTALAAGAGQAGFMLISLLASEDSGDDSATGGGTP